MFPSKTDMVIAMRNSVCYRSQLLIGGDIMYTGNRVIQYAGGYTNVFPFIKNNEKVAVRCWTADIGDVKLRTETISNYLANLNSRYFVRYNYVDSALLVNGQLYPVSVMEWVEGQTLKNYLNKVIHSPEKILGLAEQFKEMVTHFHYNNIAHGDLQHGNIIIKNDGSIVVIDYDSMYVNPLHGMPDVIKGRPEYQHPKREENLTINPHLDYFSELIIYISLLAYADNASLWNNDTEWLVFSKEDLDSPTSSAIIANLINSNNIFLSKLTSKLVESLAFSNILQLKPLEVVIEEIAFGAVADSIISKF